MGTRPNPSEVRILRAMDQARTRVWNTKKEDKEPDRLIDIRDTSGIADLLRGFRKS